MCARVSVTYNIIISTLVIIISFSDLISSIILVIFNLRFGFYYLLPTLEFTS